MDQHARDFMKVRDYALASARASEAKCLIGPSSECAGPIVRAHSVQRAKLALIADAKGRVLLMTPDQQKLGMWVARGTRQSRHDDDFFEYRNINNRLLTSRMACARHDKEIFAEIEDDKLDPRNDRHCVLLSYRAALFHWHQKMTLHREFSVLANAYPAFEVIRRYFASDARSAERTVSELSAEVSSTKPHPARIVHRHLIIDSPPRIAATGVIMRGGKYALTPPELEQASSMILPVTEVPIVVTVYPETDHEVAVISFPAVWESLARVVIPAIEEEDQRLAAALLSKTLIESTENIMVSPLAWDGYGSRRRDAIAEHFVASIGVPIEIPAPLGATVSHDYASAMVSQQEPAFLDERDPQDINLFV